jgi:hypothetical protein
MCHKPNLVGKVVGILVILLSTLFDNVFFSLIEWHIRIEESNLRTLIVIKDVHYYLRNLPTELLAFVGTEISHSSSLLTNRANRVRK